MFVKIILVLLLNVKIGFSIHCYDCNSANNSMCLDPGLYDQQTLSNYLRVTECTHGLLAPPTDQFFCRKISQTILRKHYEPEVRVTRGCGWKRHPRACYKADNEDHLETVCQCDRDLCNASGNLRFGFGPVASIVAVILISWNGISF